MNKPLSITPSVHYYCRLSSMQHQHPHHHHLLTQKIVIIQIPSNDTVSPIKNIIWNFTNLKYKICGNWSSITNHRNTREFTNSLIHIYYIILNFSFLGASNNFGVLIAIHDEIFLSKTTNNFYHSTFCRRLLFNSAYC